MVTWRGGGGGGTVVLAKAVVTLPHKVTGFIVLVTIKYDAPTHETADAH